MEYGIIQPPKHLTDYVRFYWFVEGNLPYVHHAFAYPCPEFIFCYKGHFKYGMEHRKDTTLTSGIFGQTATFSRVTLNNDNFGIFGIFLYPHAFPQLFRLPASELSDHYAAMNAVLGKDGEILEDKMILASNNAQRAKIVSNFLEARLKNVRTEYSPISSAITTIVNAYHTSSIQTLADTNFLSLRQFERRFKELSGFRPKSFLRIMRFNSVLTKDFQDKSLTEIGVESGYYDQSHFIHDFQKFSGISPKEYFKRKSLAAAGRGTVEFT
ncbi:AraC-like DNA-binding protein [Chitinophaga polysaccharea]|uniref:AraC-like DNA-binding protein n=1 Tax=Chitinophaga polysaccharea TaxID=1293035 RepID=A0A561P6X9_9BACT|nr:helix-turn-helix domain-containing protein [Chitinophaga polysaccharea]TWF33880.1 AraC-like DNA-binding protein [Chitinophaga polysaccharea]